MSKPTNKNVTIHIKRLMHNIEQLGKIGLNKDGGIDRVLCSDTDLEARNWISRYWEQVFLKKTRVDPIANLWMDLEGDRNLPAIVMGSHHDAVPCGGRFDGALGVLMATEIVETLKDRRIRLRHPLSLVSFTGEEPNPFNISTVGSKVIAGRLTKEDLHKYSHRETKELLGDAIKRMGGNLDLAENALINKKNVAAFLECHIEQGDKLDKSGLAIATVTKITGIYREKITVSGEANHAGTTMMNSRKDAYLAACEYSLAIEKAVKNLNSDEATATVGFVKVEPNEANIISGKTTLIMDMRISDKVRKAGILHKLDREAAIIEGQRKVTIQREVILDQECIPMSDTVINAFDHGAVCIGEPAAHLVSMAGHDAANISMITRTGMIFVKSVNGKSHCKEELSYPEDIEKAANAMLQALLYLDKELDGNDII